MTEQHEQGATRDMLTQHPIAVDALRTAAFALVDAGYPEAADVVTRLLEDVDVDHASVHLCWTEAHTLATYPPGACPVARTVGTAAARG